jgi:ribosomal protein S21
MNPRVPKPDRPSPRPSDRLRCPVCGSLHAEIERAPKKLKRATSDIIRDIRRHRVFYVKPGAARRAKSARARLRQRKYALKAAARDLRAEEQGR